jgi:hypothetical protein
MRMSKGITLTILAGIVLTACLTTGGCRRSGARDHTWYDANGRAISENWKIDENGKRVPDPYPRDRYGKPWVYDSDGNLVPPAPPAGTSSSSPRAIPFFFWGGSGYRSSSSGSSFRSGSGSSSSISRGGFGSTGSSSGS